MFAQGILRGQYGKAVFLSVLTVSLAALLAGCPPPTGEGEGEGEGEMPPPNSLAAGLSVEVLGVAIPDDLRPEVTFTLEDGSGNPVSAVELTDARFILDYLEDAAPGDTAHYASYTTRIEDPDRVPNSGDEAVQADYDSARLGGVSYNGDGTYTYKFAATIPADYDPSRSHQLAGQLRRRFVVDGEEYKVNVAYPFVPDGSKEGPERREIVATSACNQCHTRLSVHGDVRREVQLCIMCHTPQSTDAQSGNTLNFAVMIHKLHHGAELPSVQDGDPYQIIGFGNSVNDFSDVEFPQDIRNCQVCHKDAPQSDIHLSNPTIAGCASCHDRTWFGNPAEIPANFEPHVGGQQVDNSLCQLCHKPEGPAPAPITEAHIKPTDSAAAPGLDFKVLQVVPTTVDEGVQVAVTFEAVDKNGVRYADLSVLGSASITVGYPVPEYEATVRESVLGNVPGSIVHNANGTHTYTFKALLPYTGDTFAVAMEGRIPFTFREQTFNQGTASNAMVVFTVDGSEPTDRRIVVDTSKCNVCHDDLRAHGENRVGVEYCVMCHNVNATDIARRPAGAGPPETINFKVLIHKIHSGENLETPYTVYGFGNTAHDFTEILFPGQRQECSICHVGGSESLPLAEETLSTIVRDGEGNIVSEKLPARAACTACHDSFLVDVHAVLATDMNTQTETCAVCHGPDEVLSANKFHAMKP